MLTQTATNYLSSASNSTNSWEIVSGALADLGISAPRPAPAASMAFRPRHLRATAGSDAAQQDLQTLAGWSRPTRRGMLAGLLAVASAPVAAALPTTGGTTSAAPAAVSLTMSSLINEFARLAVSFVSLDHDADPAAWDRAAQQRNRALADLVFTYPDSLIDFAAKMTALAQLMIEEDSEMFIFRRLAEDATRLAGEAQ